MLSSLVLCYTPVIDVRASNPFDVVMTFVFSNISFYHNKNLSMFRKFFSN